MFLRKLIPKNLEKKPLPSLCPNVQISMEPPQGLTEKREKVLIFKLNVIFFSDSAQRMKAMNISCLPSSVNLIYGKCFHSPCRIPGQERHKRRLWSCQALPKSFITMDSNWGNFQVFSLPKNFPQTQDKATINIIPLRAFYYNILN